MHGLIADTHMTGVLAQQVGKCQCKRAKDLGARTLNVMVCALQMLDAVRRSEQNALALSSAQANQSTGPTAGPAAAPAGVQSAAPSDSSSGKGSHTTQIKVSALFSMLMFDQHALFSVLMEGAHPRWKGHLAKENICSLDSKRCHRAHLSDVAGTC